VALGGGTAYADGASYPFTSSATLYAQWTINSYTVTFNSIGGSAVSAITQNYNTSVSEPGAPAKANYTFGGWYSDAGLSTAVSWPYTMTASNVTFYAKWVPVNHTITFDSNGGSAV
jgi:uncharacterized repeat protein (TIGR02543 family)